MKVAVFIIVSEASLKYFVKFSVSVFLCMITFLGLIRLIVGVVFTSAYIAWWSDMPGHTSTLFTRLGVLVSRRSSILFPRVSFSFSCVREKSFAMSRSCGVCRLVFEQCCLVVNIFQLKSGKLNSRARIIMLVLIFANRDRDTFMWSMALIPKFGGL